MALACSAERNRMERSAEQGTENAPDSTKLDQLIFKKNQK
jgi:hypothetical protein